MNQEANSPTNITSSTNQPPYRFTIAQCSCHIINPKVHRVILWVDIDPITKETRYTLRIGNQRFTSLPNLDKNGQTYWRFKCAGEYVEKEEKTETTNSENHVSTSESIPSTS